MSMEYRLSCCGSIRFQSKYRHNFDVCSFVVSLAIIIKTLHCFVQNLTVMVSHTVLAVEWLQNPDGFLAGRCHTSASQSGNSLFD